MEVYLATQGVNPKEHPVKQELERIRVYMNRVKEITDKKKAAKLDRGCPSINYVFACSHGEDDEHFFEISTLRFSDTEVK
ncbi:hypothetical protein A6R68_19672 [Neotoma lepida]|uniref:Nuclear nucleic acid-binding protein C1D n=1 Tax=Neotoma lepida TaxID=56216 RepID=A0A1A6HH96_NEOLE|nr:hypothetical protein A6R68_19672 [Neotoma lepida]